jgi:serine/threonine protein phosphatase 1
MNTYVIADLHGRYDLLALALDQIERDAGPAGGTFIVLGDFVDRGPQSREIIERLMEGPDLPNWRWIVLQGNHEAMMVSADKGGRREGLWLINGGYQTLESYNYEIPRSHLAWLRNLPVYFEDEHRIYVHAGVKFDAPLELTKKQTLQWMLYPSDQLYHGAEIHPDHPHMSGKHVVHGHHQSPNHPLLKPHRTNLDSFAWATGRAVVGVFDGAGGPTRVLQIRGRPGL